MATLRGRALPLSVPRRVVGDLLHFARRVPGVPVERRMRLAGPADARRAATPRPCWYAIFARAFARVAAGTPELRRAYRSFPWGHLYEHPFSVAAVAIERAYHGEPALFFGLLDRPEERSLAELHARVCRLRDAPLGSVGAFRRTLGIGRLPRPLRRAVWWAGLNASGRQRARLFGTFGVSSYARLGAQSLHPLSPLTITLNYGPLDGRGRATVRLVYDHRVLDGAVVARALAALEATLNGVITEELRAMGDAPNRAARERLAS